MPSSHNFERVRSRTLKIMTTAFDNAHKCLPAIFRENDQARRKLALLILRHIERGEHDPECLADFGSLDFYGDYAAAELILSMPELSDVRFLKRTWPGASQMSAV